MTPHQHFGRQVSPFLVLACLAIYLLFTLQQVVISDWRGTGISLGGTAIRIFVATVSVFMLWRHGIPPLMRMPLLAILACLAVLAASVIASEHPDIAIKFAVKYATGLLFLWTCLNLSLAFPSFPRAATLAALIALWGNILLGLGVRFGLPFLKNLSLAFHPESTFKYLPRVSGIYEHPSIFGATAVLSAILAFQLYSWGELSKRAVQWGAAGAIVALLLTEARNNLVPLLALGSALLWLKRDDLRTINRWAIASGLSVVLAMAGVMLWQRYAELTSAVNKENLLTAFTLGRTYIWGGAFEAWRTHPWFGLGAGVFQFLTPDFTGGRFDRGELHAHNVLLAILSETGLAGLVAYVLLVYSLWAPLLRRHGGIANRTWALIWLIVLPCFGLFDFYLPFYGFSIHLALVIAYQYASAYHRQETGVLDTIPLRLERSRRATHG